jgi:hypothetical protein
MGIAIGNLLSRLMRIDVFVVPWTWMAVGLLCALCGIDFGLLSCAQSFEA